jgi:undecaprenyl-diphosphatase
MLQFQIFISTISDTATTLFTLLLLSAVLYFLKDKKFALLTAASALSATVVTYALKHILKIPRPEHMLVVEDGYRFPSGHATMAAVVSGLLYYYARTRLQNSSLRYLLYALALLWLPLIAYSRIYLGVHLWIDVLTGAVIGFTATCITSKVIPKLEAYF